MSVLTAIECSSADNKRIFIGLSGNIYTTNENIYQAGSSLTECRLRKYIMIVKGGVFADLFQKNVGQGINYYQGEILSFCIPLFLIGENVDNRQFSLHQYVVSEIESI
eukprot:TRINITY_DN71738_c0_g1_i1.p2 TRINITY_DN71738_c0_g1~~TRINITY_DN71738_c0_g1_i1.p2  ORF type:complete len:108 (+),score=5.45 TRINITY_DN71738_c0_g1_i1:65-388(+)